MAQLFANAARSTLTASITAGSTQLQINPADQALFPVATGADWFKVALEDSSGNLEFMQVQRAVGQSLLTISARAAEDATKFPARAFVAGSLVELRMTAADLASSIAHPSIGTGAHSASAIAVTPVGAIASTNVQSALQELDSEKADLAATASALGGKVSLTGAETIAGVKTFSSSPMLPGNATTALEAVPKQQLDSFSGRNRVINGTFSVNQRAFAGGALTAGTYGHDRWKAGAGGATYTVSGETATITAGTLQQVIEGVNVPEGGTYTLSWAGTAQARVDGGSYAASPITVTGKTAATNTTVEFDTGTVSLVQYEAGGTATTFERRLFSVELAACLRYYEVSGHDSYYSGSVQTGGSYYATSSFKATKRIAAPTVVTTGGGATGFDASNPTVSSSSADGFTVTKGSNATNAGGFYIYTWTASAEL